MTAGTTGSVINHVLGFGCKRGRFLLAPFGSFWDPPLLFGLTAGCMINHVLGFARIIGEENKNAGLFDTASQIGYAHGAIYENYK